MENESKRTITIGEYIAEMLEAKADEMPSGYKDQADILREHARQTRERKDERMVRILFMG